MVEGQLASNPQGIAGYKDNTPPDLDNSTNSIFLVGPALILRSGYKQAALKEQPLSADNRADKHTWAGKRKDHHNHKPHNQNYYNNLGYSTPN